MKRRIATMLIALSVLIAAQVFGQTNVLDFDLIPAVDKIPRGESTALALKLTVHDTWHINSDRPREDFLIPTEITFDPAEGVTFGKLQFPEAEIKSFAFSETPMAVYEGTVYVFTTITVPPDFAGKSVQVSGTVTYQACNDQICLPPQDYVFSKKLAVAQPGEAIVALHPEIFQQAAQEPPPSPSVSEESSLARTIESRGMLVAFLAIFISGLALNLTPCVYPLIPITVSYFGGQAGGKKGNLLLHAIIYVLGMAVTYSLLGVLAALTGSILGGWLQNPFVLLFIAAVMGLLALSMFGVYEIRVPTALANFAGQSKQGYFGTLFMGLTVGIIAAPCIGPFVLALFTYVGEKGDPLLGFWMFFVLAIGLGVPFVILALFSGALNKLPRSGAWMIWVRKIFGFILIGVALYFLDPLISNDLLYYTALGVTFILGGLYLAWVDPTPNSGKIFVFVRNLIGIAFIVSGIFLWTNGVEAHVEKRLEALQQNASGGIVLENKINWKPYSEGAMNQAIANHQPVIIDFFADWCIPCKELDKFTFSDERVIKASKDFSMLKADLTKFNSPEVQALKDQFQIKGVPTVVFLDPNGQEIPGTRVVGFINAEDFLEIMNNVLATTNSVTNSERG